MANSDSDAKIRQKKVDAIKDKATIDDHDKINDTYTKQQDVSKPHIPDPSTETQDCAKASNQTKAEPGQEQKRKRADESEDEMPGKRALVATVDDLRTAIRRRMAEIEMRQIAEGIRRFKAQQDESAKTIAKLAKRLAQEERKLPDQARHIERLESRAAKLGDWVENGRGGGGI